MSDWLAILLSFVYVFAVLGLTELVRAGRGYSYEFSRKLVHIAVGMWSVPTVLLFESQWLAIVPPASFVVLNLVSYRWRVFRVIELDDRANLGTIYFPLAFCAIILLFWPMPDLIVAALMPLTWGDAMAGVFGKHYGHIAYQVFGNPRTVEGSITMFIFSVLATGLALGLLPGAMQGFGGIIAAALLVAIVATLVEGLSPWGLDNLTVPAAAGLVLYLWQGMLG